MTNGIPDVDAPSPGPGHADRDGEASRQWLPLILAWLVVLVPSGWAVGQVVLKSLALFR